MTAARTLRRTADEPVVGLHHRVGEEHLPLDGADREDREAAVVGELAEPVGEVALPCRRSRVIRCGGIA